MRLTISGTSLYVREGKQLYDVPYVMFVEKQKGQIRRCETQTSAKLFTMLKRNTV